MNLIKIKNIKEREEKINVYDIEVKDNHNFFANNILVHNCHNYGTKRLIPFLEHKFKYKIGLTATVERMDQSHWKIFECFNYNIFKYTPQEALEDDVLNPFVFFNIGVELDFNTSERYDILTREINTIMQAGGGFKKIMRSTSGLKYRMLSVLNDRKQLVNNYNRKFDVVRAIVSKHKNDKIIIFSQFNKQTNKFYWELLESKIKARIIHSGIDKTKRDQTLMDFKNDKFNVLLTTKVLDEGYNLPSIDTAIITAGDSSPKQTIQRLGRVLRKKEKISSLYQVYCLETIEEDQGNTRAKLFKQLSSNYDEMLYTIRDKEFKLT